MTASMSTWSVMSWRDVSLIKIMRWKVESVESNHLTGLGKNKGEKCDCEHLIYY